MTSRLQVCGFVWVSEQVKKARKSETAERAQLHTQGSKVRISKQGNYYFMRGGSKKV